MSKCPAPTSRRLTSSEIRERLQDFDSRLARRALYPHEEAELEGLLTGTWRKPVHIPAPSRVGPLGRSAAR